MIKLKTMLKEEDGKKVLYSAIVLDEKSKNTLLSTLSEYIPKDWKVFAHHMTVAFGKPLPNQSDVDQLVVLTATEIGISDMAVAVKVEGFESLNKISHITLAINVNAGGKPVMSNNITDWKPIEHIKLTGVAKNITE